MIMISIMTIMYTDIFIQNVIFCLDIPINFLDKNLRAVLITNEIFYQTTFICSIKQIFSMNHPVRESYNDLNLIIKKMRLK